ncbi:MAG: hypothetical protein GKR90_11135 [Pseudomonadales bacterium]|nr:hypothetical protein [Pseudomonadales bacterium]
MNLKQNIIRAISVCIVAVSSQFSYALNEGLDLGPDNMLVVPLFHSKAVGLDRPASRVSVGNPDIADILILRASQLYVIGKDLGTTNVMLWDKNDDLVGKFDIQITHNLEDLKQKLHTLLPEEEIEVFSAQRAIVLRGTVTSVAVMDAALTIADGYLAQIQTGTQAVEFEQQGSSKRADKQLVKSLT